MLHPAVRLVPLLALALAACHHDDPAKTAATGTEDADTTLPGPDAAGGPVTGMPSKPGPGPVGPPPTEEEADTALVGETAPDAVTGAEAGVTASSDAGAASNATADDAMPTVAEPSDGDAVAVVRGYYAALAAHDTARAHAYWVQGTLPPAEGDDPDTASLSVDVGAPGRLDAAAGSRYLQVPVTLTRTLRDGGTTRTTGVVTLRRAVVDGATPEQRAWRIAFVQLAAAPAQ